MSSGPSSTDDAAEDKLRAAIQSISGQARSTNLVRVGRLSRALEDVAGGRRDQATRREAADVAHQILGSAGTFGFDGASQLAGELQRYFLEADLEEEVQLEIARDQVRRLRDELTAEPDYQPEDDERDATS